MRAAFLLLLLALAGAPLAIALDPGAAMPRISAPALAESQPAIAFEALKGRVVYVDFWASWCVPCRQSMPVLDTLYRKHAAKGFTVVGVNKDVSAADADRFLKRVPVTFPLVADREDQAARAFAVKAMPSGYLIDRRGVVRHVHRGFTAETSATLEKEIEQLLGEAR